ncbi:hypothetical protein GCM10022244_04800 [Streptomyces gulbargensis]|uniref:Uncharacterized protein n=1 Tax=Streptomyces gulbargensis TaxID=364901 RepID=A0ABP7L9K7_9ACTN
MTTGRPAGMALIVTEAATTTVTECSPVFTAFALPLSCHTGLVVTPAFIGEARNGGPADPMDRLHLVVLVAVPPPPGDPPASGAHVAPGPTARQAVRSDGPKGARARGAQRQACQGHRPRTVATRVRPPGAGQLDQRAKIMIRMPVAIALMSREPRQPMRLLKKNMTRAYPENA